MNMADEMQIRPQVALSSVVAQREHPLAVFERICLAEHYESERVSDDQLHITVTSLWSHHDLSLSFDKESEQIQLFMAFEGRIPSGRTDDMCRLMSLINERLSVGHFDFWHKNGTLVYRSAMSLRGGARLKTEQAQDMIALAIDAAQRGYPATQYVLWGGKTPEDALTTALVDLAAHSE